MPKDDPVEQEIRDRLSKHTLWLNADNFEEMCAESLKGLTDTQNDLANTIWAMAHTSDRTTTEVWRLMCAAALAVVEWRLSGRVRP